MALRTGDRIQQDTYGAGEIIDLNQDYVTIAFDDGSTRKFVTSKVLLQPSNTPAPPTRKPAPRARAKRGASASIGAALAKGTAS